MVRVSVATLGISRAQGEFVIRPHLKVFGPQGTALEQTDIDLRQRERAYAGPPRDGWNVITLRRYGEYLGRLPQRRLSPNGGVLQVIWHISYVVVTWSLTGSPTGSARGWGNVPQSWRISPRWVPTPRTPGSAPTLTYDPRPTPQLQKAYGQNLALSIDATGQDYQTGVDCGEITSRLNISLGKSENERVSLTVQGSAGDGGTSAGVGVGYMREVATSESGSFGCAVVVPYASA